jgi:hypothetical protein
MAIDLIGSTSGAATVSCSILCMRVPDIDILTALAAAGIGLSRGINLFCGPPRAANPPTIPHQAVFVLASGGPEQEAYSDGTTTERRYSAVQVRVRSNPRGFDAGNTLARQVRDALHHRTLTGYLDVRAMQSEPIYIGEDEPGHHEFSVNLELWTETT